MILKGLKINMEEEIIKNPFPFASLSYIANSSGVTNFLTGKCFGVG